VVLVGALHARGGRPRVGALGTATAPRERPRGAGGGGPAAPGSYPAGVAPPEPPPPDRDPGVTALLDPVAVTAEHPHTVPDLPGGLTDRTLQVVTPSAAVVVHHRRGEGITVEVLPGHTLTITDGSGPPDSDSGEWGMQKYERAVFDGPQLDRLLEAAGRGDGPL
jgi:hypothetical protein